MKENRFSQQSIGIPYYIIQDAIHNKWTYSLRFFIHLKAIYTSGTIYKATYRRVAETTGYSVSQANKHVNILIDKGLIRRHNNNISCNSTKKLHINRKELDINKICRIKVTNRKDQKLFISLKALETNIEQQEYRIRQRSDLKKLVARSKSNYSMSAADYRKMNKLKKRVSGENCGHIGISNKGIGDLLGVSKGTGYEYKKKMRSMGLISTHRCIKRVRKCSRWEFNQLRAQNCVDSSYMHKNGWLLKESYPYISIVYMNQ